MSNNILSFVPRECGILAFIKAKQQFKEIQTDEIGIEIAYSPEEHHSYGARMAAAWNLIGFKEGRPVFIAIDDIGEIDYEFGESPLYTITPLIQGMRHVDSTTENRIAAQILGITEQLMEEIHSIERVSYKTLGKNISQERLEDLSQDFARTVLFPPCNHKQLYVVR